MNDIAGIVFIGFLVLAAILFLLYLSRPYEVSAEEFEKRAHEAPSLISAGMSGLQKFLDPAAGKAMEVIEDLKQGYYEGEQESGDKPEAGAGDVQEGHSEVPIESSKSLKFRGTEFSANQLMTKSSGERDA